MSTDPPMVYSSMVMASQVYGPSLVICDKCTTTERVSVYVPDIDRMAPLSYLQPYNGGKVQWYSFSSPSAFQDSSYIPLDVMYLNFTSVRPTDTMCVDWMDALLYYPVSITDGFLVCYYNRDTDPADVPDRMSTVKNIHRAMKMWRDFRARVS